eukprot:1520493-Ditylum_brightwellii.AAC.1
MGPNEIHSTRIATDLLGTSHQAKENSNEFLEYAKMACEYKYRQQNDLAWNCSSSPQYLCPCFFIGMDILGCALCDL